MNRHLRLVRLGSFLCGVLIVTGCGVSSQSSLAGHSATATAAATLPPTITLAPLPNLKLSWQARHLPDGIWAVAPSDGNTLYGCTHADGATSGDALASHDGGSDLQTVTVPMTNHGGTCALWPDYTQPNVAVMKIVSNGHGPYRASAAAAPYSAPGPGFDRFDLFTIDGGQSWTQLPNDVIVDESVTVGATTYALIATVQNPASVSLARSSDGFASWQHLNPPNLSGNNVEPADPTDHTTYPRHIWVNPDGRHILFADAISGAITVSVDGGQTWQTLVVPGNPLSDLAVQPPVAGRTWSLCAHSVGTTVCTHDGGQTWVTQPTLGVVYSLFTITPVGDLLALGSEDSGAFNLLRLPAGSDQWQSLGTEPGSFISYSPLSGNGILWAYAFGGTQPFPTQGWYEAAYAPQ